MCNFVTVPGCRIAGEAAPQSLEGTMSETYNGLRIEEFGTELHPSLEAARRAAAPVLAQLVANTIQAGLDSGRYIVENGVVRLSEEVKSHEQLPAGERRPRLGILP